jgi:hypothetical protein
MICHCTYSCSPNSNVNGITSNTNKRTPPQITTRTQHEAVCVHPLHMLERDMMATSAPACAPALMATGQVLQAFAARNLLCTNVVLLRHIVQHASSKICTLLACSPGEPFSQAGCWLCCCTARATCSASLSAQQCEHSTGRGTSWSSSLCCHSSYHSC